MNTTISWPTAGTTRKDDRGIPFFGENGFRLTELLNPKSSENTPHLFCMILVVYLGRGIFHPVYIYISVFFSPKSKSVFGLRRTYLNLPKLRNPSIKVAHPDCSPRQKIVCWITNYLVQRATAAQLQTTALSVRVSYQSASTVPCGICLVSPQARSTKQCQLLQSKWATYFVFRQRIL